MKLKLDENLGHRAQALLVAAGHDVATVHEENRRLHRRVVQILREAVLTEVKLLQSRAAFEDERRAQLGLFADGREKVADHVVFGNRIEREARFACALLKIFLERDGIMMMMMPCRPS